MSRVRPFDVRSFDFLRQQLEAAGGEIVAAHQLVPITVDPKYVARFVAQRVTCTDSGTVLAVVALQGAPHVGWKTYPYAVEPCAGGALFRTPDPRGPDHHVGSADVGCHRWLARALS